MRIIGRWSRGDAAHFRGPRSMYDARGFEPSIMTPSRARSLLANLYGLRGEADSWHCADCVEEAPGRQLEMLPRDGGHVTMSCRTGRVACRE